MSDKLIIVESPTKAKTIAQFLGKGFKVVSSYGHLRDLPKSKMGVDIEHDFEPHYVIPTKSRKTANELKKLAQTASLIYYATDEDREGEAIAWHLDEIFEHPAKTKRIAFHEITKTAITGALEHPRQINRDLVNAQQARRILDRLVGYELSPFLWKKVAKGLSAGRVQSGALRLIVEREREIEAFQKEEYWTIEAEFSKDGQSFTATLYSLDGKKLEKFDINNEKQAQEISEKINNSQFKAARVEQKETKKNPPAPFTTSTMQQRANRMLGFSAKQTMVIAQQLYEGVKLGKGGSTGLITYMRTDSLNLADEFLSQTQDFIKDKFGSRYATGPKKYTAKSKLAQEAHEAIRPTSPMLSPESVKAHLDNRQFRLYDLIWRRALASQMPPAEILNTSIDLDNDKGQLFRASGSVITFDGFLKVLPKAADTAILPAIKENDSVKTEKIEPQQHFTEPLPRYTEASLIKILEEYGIGRPSTYAPTIATIQDRNYVEREDKKLKPTEIGRVVSDLLVEHFPKVVDYNFTAKIEDDFDEIANGQLVWQKMLKDFYGPFHENVEQKSQEVTKEETVGQRELGQDPDNGEPIYVKLGRFGPYVQKGEGGNGDKPKFASLKPGQSSESLTLKEALELLSLPKVLGADEDGQEINVGIGRFGPYLRVDKKFYSIRGEDAYHLDLNRARELIKEAKEKKDKKNIKEFAGTEVKVLDGRFGPYVTDGVKNAKIPKEVKPEELTLEQCQDLLAKAKLRRGRKR